MTHLRSAALLLAACSRESPAQPDTAPACPVDLASFCAYEFGGECPTFDEAAAMSCDDFHFASAGEGDHEPRSGDGDEWCWAAIVLCDRVDEIGRAHV